MKNVSFILKITAALFICVCLSGCLSIPKKSGYSHLPAQKTNYVVAINTVNVIVDRVNENDLSEQFEQITESLINNSVDFEDAEVLNLDICVNQRSFYKGLDKHNSIYMLYSLTDSLENTVFKQGYYTYTDNGLEQSPVQYKLSKRLAKSVNSYIKKSRR